MEHTESGCSKDDDCCGELICKDVALSYFFGNQHHCMKQHDPLCDTTPACRETQSNLRATELDLHAENVDFVAQQPPRKLDPTNYKEKGGSALMKVGIWAFGILDEEFGISDSFLGLLGIERGEDPTKTTLNVLQGILDTIKDVRNEINKLGSKLDALTRAVICGDFKGAQTTSDSFIGTIERAYEDMSSWILENITVPVDEAEKLFERVQYPLEALGDTLVGESGTIPSVILCLSAYENDASNLAEYWTRVEYYRQTYKNYMLSGLLVMIYAQEISQNSFKKITLDNIAKSVAEDIETMYNLTGIAFPSGLFLHVRNSNRVLANFGQNTGCVGDYKNRCGGMESIVKGNCNCNTLYEEEEYCEPVHYDSTYWPDKYNWNLNIGGAGGGAPLLVKKLMKKTDTRNSAENILEWGPYSTN